MTIAPACFNKRTVSASCSAIVVKALQAAVVAKPDTSILSLTANGIPYNGNCLCKFSVSFVKRFKA